MPRFIIYNDSKGKFRYRLIADNNQEICTSGAYASVSNAKAGCEVLSRNALAGAANITLRTTKVLKEEARAEREKAKAKESARKAALIKKETAIKEKEKKRLDAAEKSSCKPLTVTLKKPNAAQTAIKEKQAKRQDSPKKVLA